MLLEQMHEYISEINGVFKMKGRASRCDDNSQVIILMFSSEVKLFQHILGSNNHHWAVTLVHLPAGNVSPLSHWGNY